MLRAHALKALERCLSTSTSIRQSAAIIDPRYQYSFTHSMLPPSTVIGKFLSPVLHGPQLKTFSWTHSLSAQTSLLKNSKLFLLLHVVASTATLSANSYLYRVSSQAFLLHCLGVLSGQAYRVSMPLLPPYYASCTTKIQPPHMHRG